eukprot:gnl/Trimastix_PCT/1659.p1 GENE.gnl/Trimastix_PCT/1659~~gnl/Trimastix_PCT/1659.p1  ORF type:complete len:472 (+),score=60.23 gnl/Trimastix_PCT/1659:109-1416(+)
MSTEERRQTMISEFTEMIGTISPDEAEDLLQRTDWNAEMATELFFQEQAQTDRSHEPTVPSPMPSSPSRPTSPPMDDWGPGNRLGSPEEEGEPPLDILRSEGITVHVDSGPCASGNHAMEMRPGGSILLKSGRRPPFVLQIQDLASWTTESSSVILDLRSGKKLTLTTEHGAQVCRMLEDGLAAYMDTRKETKTHSPRCLQSMETTDGPTPRSSIDSSSDPKPSPASPSTSTPTTRTPTPAHEDTDSVAASHCSTLPCAEDVLAGRPVDVPVRTREEFDVEQRRREGATMKPALSISKQAIVELSFNLARTGITLLFGVLALTATGTYPSQGLRVATFVISLAPLALHWLLFLTRRLRGDNAFNEVDAGIIVLLLEATVFLFAFGIVANLGAPPLHHLFTLKAVFSLACFAGILPMDIKVHDVDEGLPWCYFLLL